MSAVRANTNTATYTDAAFAPSFSYAYNPVSDATSVVSVFVSGIIGVLSVIARIILSVLLKVVG